MPGCSSFSIIRFQENILAELSSISTNQNLRKRLFGLSERSIRGYSSIM